MAVHCFQLMLTCLCLCWHKAFLYMIRQCITGARRLVCRNRVWITGSDMTPHGEIARADLGGIACGEHLCSVIASGQMLKERRIMQDIPDTQSQRPCHSQKSGTHLAAPLHTGKWGPSDWCM